MLKHALLSLLFGLLAAAAPVCADSIGTAALEAGITELSKAAGAVVAVAAWRLDGTGPRVLVNADERFPMGSTYEVAIAAAVFAALDAGRVQLDRMIAIDPARLVASEVIADRFVHPGVSLSVHNLLELMLTQSDNTAADVDGSRGPAAGCATTFCSRSPSEPIRRCRGHMQHRCRALRSTIGLCSRIGR